MRFQLLLLALLLSTCAPSVALACPNDGPCQFRGGHAPPSMAMLNMPKRDTHDDAMFPHRGPYDYAVINAIKQDALRHAYSRVKLEHKAEMVALRAAIAKMCKNSRSCPGAQALSSKINKTKPKKPTK